MATFRRRRRHAHYKTVVIVVHIYRDIYIYLLALIHNGCMGISILTFAMRPTFQHWLLVNSPLVPDYVVRDPQASPVWEITGTGSTRPPLPPSPLLQLVELFRFQYCSISLGYRLVWFDRVYNHPSNRFSIGGIIAGLAATLA